jgi:hypothetical protein
MTGQRPSSEERNAAVRAAIRPLEPGERPGALKAAVGLCLLLGAGNLVTMLAGAEISGETNSAGQAVVLAAVLGLLALGMWAREAMAVLIFEALLIVTMLFAFLGLMSAANATAVLGSAVVLAVASVLFWKLIRVLARIQAPRVPSS